MKSIKALRRYTVGRNFPKPTTLKRALERLGYLQADPIRSPARAQDLILNQRVKNYHAGDLERLYPKLDIEEDFFVNYGYVTRSLHNLMPPRNSAGDESWTGERRNQVALLFEFVKQHGTVHPKDVDNFFAHGKVTNYWGGSSNATTYLLDMMHYAGMLRVTRREKGIRLYSPREFASVENQAEAQLDALADVVINLYAPLPSSSLTYYLRRLQYAIPQLKSAIPALVKRTKERLRHARIEGVDWYWPAQEKKLTRNERVRLLAPFDPLVHDRARFELLWNWTYRFEAYTPAPKRKLGYYALPLLWRDDVIGWANLSVKEGRLNSEIHYANTQPRDRIFKQELDAELARMKEFLNLPT